MRHFHAHLLFDGQQWHHNVSFAVDELGVYHQSSCQRSDPNVIMLNTVIPGFVNCHSHSFQRAMAGMGERLSGEPGKDSFWTWRAQMYHLVQKLSPDEFQRIADWLYIEMLEAGYTSVGEFHYLHHQPDGTHYDKDIELSLRLIRAGVHTGMRLTMLPVFYRLGSFGQAMQSHQLPFKTESFSDYLSFYQAIADKIPRGHNIGACAHSVRGVDLASLQAMASAFNPTEQPIHIHIAEQPAEVNDCINFYGKRPVQLLLDDVGLTEKWTLVHATHINDEECQGIIDSNAVVGICPLTEANLGDGVFPMTQFFNSGGHFAIGSDSHIRIDPFEELRLIEYSQRLTLLSRACLATTAQPSPGLNLARRTYQGGNQSLMNRSGRLAEGYYADFIELNPDHPALFRLDPQTLWDELIFSGGREMIHSVYSRGNRVVTQGKHRHHDDALDALKDIYRRLG